jgi:hypothetical protein
MSWIGLSGVPTLKQKNIWPDPKQSIGERWCAIGKQNCWEAIGPAQEVADKVSRDIKNLLQSQHEYLNKDIRVPRFLLFSLYMIGETVEQSRPTIIFSCENKVQRQRAREVVRESSLLAAYPAVMLAESSRPPRLCRGPQQLGDMCLDDDVRISNVAETSTYSDRLVYYSHPLSRIHGIPVTIESNDDIPTSRQSTLGVVRVGEELFGITVAHAFMDHSENNELSDSGDMEFSLEYASDDEDTEDENFIGTTSRGELSPALVSSCYN